MIGFASAIVPIEAGECVYKYYVNLDRPIVQAPKNARFLSASVQGDQIVAWAIGDPDGDWAPRKLAALATGEPVRSELDGLEFVDTVQMDDGLVFHVVAERGTAR